MKSDEPKILGINKRCYPMHDMDEPGGWSMSAPEISTVLVEGDIGDYAAYTGIGPPDWVARHGNKVSFEEACVHFPGGQLKRELYRD